ncbi:MAG: thiamine pyrophosphate-binding protein [Rhodospirillaceae bacterium]|nr:thiamine pyrophosphate-binding protein [Rhodospirillaceae bacterium]
MTDTTSTAATLHKVARRKFLSKVAVAGAASALPVASSSAEPAATESKPGALPPSAAAREAEFGAVAAPTQLAAADTTAKIDCGSDFMTDVIKSLGIDYVFSNPGSSFLGLHESIVNYGGNRAPEFITAMHEESAVAMANGYYKAAGKPAATLCHSTVGLQHAAMAIYNAWCDRVPVINMLGNTLDLTKRLGGNDWRHSAQDPVAMVRDFVKWDDQPTTLQGFAESFVHGYKIACTPPMEPVAIVLDSELQELELTDRAALSIPKYTPSIPPQGDAGALREAAKLLVAAERPVIIADRLARTQAGMDGLVELAEVLGAPVIDLASRQNMPTTHALMQNASRGPLITQADVILGLEVTDVWGQINVFDRNTKTSTSRLKPGCKLITVSVNDLYMKSNYQDFQRYAAVDLSIQGDGEATLPALIEAVNAAMPNGRKALVSQRAEKFIAQHAANFEAARQAAAVGWDAGPVSTSRLCMDLWQAIKGEDWALVSVGASEGFISNWPHRLWPFTKTYQYLGYGAGGGVGYGLPAAVGAALANKALGRFSVNIQCDGDFMYANGALWTAAHHKIPLLTVMHNNRGYGQETMLVQGLANRRNRGIDTAHIGTEINNPPIDYAKLAQGMGVWSEGPITDPSKLAGALRRAVEVVKRGAPALVDVVTQTR